LDGDACVLVGVLSALSSVEVALVGVGFSRVEIAVLEDDGRIAKDEVDRSINVTLPIELAEGVDIKGVLVADKAAAVEDGEVGAGSESYGLVLARTGGVLDR
jgi:hypothetical protein